MIRNKQTPQLHTLLKSESYDDVTDMYIYDYESYVPATVTINLSNSRNYHEYELQICILPPWVLLK